jgi:lipopolysaccharide export system permease protein
MADGPSDGAASPAGTGGRLTMRLSGTLSAYLGRQFFFGIGFVFLVMTGLVLLVDVVEHLRRAAGREAASLGVVLTMAFLQLPGLSQKLLPFSALFGSIWTFSRLTRTNELVVARAAGVSVWQFLAPPLALAAAVGAVVVTLFSPLASAMSGRYEQLEAKYLEGRPSLLEVASTGLWLRQADPDGQSVVHARRVSAEGLELEGVIIFLYDRDHQFVGRIDAAQASLQPGYWDLRGVLLSRPDAPARRLERHQLRTSLTLAQVQDSFASPETLSFWSLPAFIDTLEEAGFSAVRHRLHWHSLAATPVLLCAMVLLAATFSLRLTRRGQTGLLIAAGVAAGFLLYFVSDVVYAFGLAGNLPASLAAWTPTGVAALLGLALLFHLEDG